MSHSGGHHKIHPQKKAAEAAFLAVPYYPLDSSNVFRLRTFLALGNGELNLLAFCQGLEAAALNLSLIHI